MSLTTYGTRIDLRDIPLRDRTALILNTYLALEVGQTMDLLSDDDPSPLYDLERWPGGFVWDLTQAGPSLWRVRILCFDKSGSLA